MQQAQLTRIKALWSGVMPAALGVSLLALAGCTMVGDGLTGVRVHRADVTSCVKDCNDRFKNLYSQEQQLHLTNVNNCQGLSQPDKDACLAAEDARHEAAMDALGAAKVECQNDCHRQGSGVGG
jgi:hypothetical protein